MRATAEPDSGWVETPAVTVENPGSLGRQMLQFFGARAIAERLGACTLSNFAFPDWNLTFPKVDASRFRSTVHVKSADEPTIAAVLDIAKAEPSAHIVIDTPLQRQSLYLARETYREIFPVVAEDLPPLDEDELLVHVRAGDPPADDDASRPLTPIGFYRDLVARTGLRPVFLGQLDDGLYVRALRQAFPGARFIPSQGDARDFDTIRRARNIVAAVSTLSVAAAWLSDAETVFLPLSGFLNPAHRRDVDLLPIDDPRYRFFLFPLNHALPEAAALEHHARMEGAWKEVSRAQLRRIRAAAPFVGWDEAGADARTPPADFDERAYLHAHLDAALAVSEGWYADGWHHYVDIGRRLGYGAAKAEAKPGVALVLVAHVSKVGDMMAAAETWLEPAGGNWIEGFALHAAAALAGLGIEYQALDADEPEPGWTPVGAFCGTRGKSRPLRGFAMRVAPAAAGHFICRYAGRFADGEEVGPLTGGDACRSSGGAPLVGMFVSLRAAEQPG
ncbi:MAG: hypothetical protein J0I21_15755 [Alphaproteobacteria bacterium]|nr:hypothetical protein [Alphaproteobacteria bacterium]